ncbi:hypothetical protein [Aquimarina sediminis]|uniref:hypothetical protein n=1 Tax=Aquimarina sediminis TaxID=2070536 RepID=UPI000CA04779|nr:hypothetical protein [Aquimarina sediminis]
MYQIAIKTILAVSLLFLNACSAQGKKSSINEEKSRDSVSDTLAVGYTYWWPQSGPFVGYCGDEYALVFLGTVQFIDIPAKDSTSVVVSQQGGIQINEVLAVRDLKKNRYMNQNLLVSDCFYGKDLKKGDRVMVFCYEYEDNYSIAGRKSILKIEETNDPIVQSIKKYIKANQNPIAIKSDILLWQNYGLDDQLKQIINCKEAMD